MSADGYFKFSNPISNPDLADVQDVLAEDVKKSLNQVHIIDVRNPDEFTGELGHIPGANLIVLNTLPDHLDQIPRDKTIVFVCKSGGRSGRAAAFALEEGYEHVYNMRGGMLRWNELKFETE